MDILAKEFVSCTARWGLTVSTSKTKVMAVGDDSARCGIHLESGDVIDQVASFTYLGGSLDDNGSLEGEVAVQLAKASFVFGSLQMPISQYKPLSIRTKRLVYTAIVLITLFYGAETWALKVTHLRWLNVFHHACSRAILGHPALHSGRTGSPARRLKSESDSQQTLVSFCDANVFDGLVTGWIPAVSPSRSSPGNIRRGAPVMAPRRDGVMSLDLTWPHGDPGK